MLRGITALQFAEWRTYADVEPWDEERADARAASVVAAVLNTRPGRRAGSRTWELEECLISYGSKGKPPAGPAPARTAAEARKLAAAVRRTMDAMIAQQAKRKAGE